LLFLIFFLIISGWCSLRFDYFSLLSCTLNWSVVACGSSFSMRFLVFPMSFWMG
jgi:hypothetical protein